MVTAMPLHIYEKLMLLLGVHKVQGVPPADESVCRASSFVRTHLARVAIVWFPDPLRTYTHARKGGTRLE